MRIETGSLADRVSNLESVAPLETQSLLILAAVSVGATLLTIVVIYLILSVCRLRRRREKKWKCKTGC